jgi:ribosomal protein S18 acetylase RimI-like enzyme
MGIPPDWKGAKSSSSSSDDTSEAVGHQQRGGTVAIHSLAVAKEHQGMGLGSVLMKAYIQRIKDSKCADNLALLAHDHLIGFYTGLGFTNAGPSSSQFGGGGWNNMVIMPDSQ